MKQQIQTIAYTIIILAGISCHHSKGTEIYNQLQLADSYMATKPEISLQILDSLNLTECNKDHYFALLYAQAKYRNYIKSENDSLIKAALNYYSQSDNQSMKSRAYLVASQIYSEMGDLETALRYIHMSAQSANKTADYWTQSFIQYEWGWLLRDAGNIDLSTEKFEFSLAYAKKANDTIQMLSRMRELCYNYLAKNNLEQSLSYINKGLKLYDGDLAIGAFGIVNRIVFLFVMIVMGLNQGMQPIAGYNFGAKQYHRVNHVMKLTVIAATIITTSGFIVGEFIPRLAVSAFTTDETLVNLSANGLRIVVMFFPIIGFQMVTSNFFQSIGMARKAIILSLSRQVLILIPCLFILPLFFGSHGVWISMPISDLAASVLAAIMLYRQFDKFRKHSA